MLTMTQAEIDDGLILYEKWKNGPFTDTDGTERLEIWLWEHLHDLFRALEQSSKLVSLTTEVMKWHIDPSSPDYNACERDRCYWCERADAAIKLTQQLNENPKSRSR